MAGTGKPTNNRHLPEHFYGGFDIRQLADGSKRYRLPHTLKGSVMQIVTGAPVMGMVAAVTAIAVLALGVPVEPFWFGAAVAFLALHAAVTVPITLWALITGYRCATFITIRPDGLVWNDAKFFAAVHIWLIGYGITSREGKPDETFEPRIEIQVGTRTVLLAEDVDPTAGKMFMRLFSEDTRRYWHGHN
jgi:hypothetical protein